MSNLVVLDGREGEGGGQVLRSALTLSLITGRPFRLEHVRGGRKPPGLKAQHLTCVTGAAAVGNARVVGAALGSQTVEFHPGEISTAPRTLDVGTAGATTLLFQCLFYPLALAGGAHLTLRGGTHVTYSPSFDYLDEAWRPMVKHYGLDATLHLDVAGFFPQGGGALRAEIAPLTPAADATPHEFGPASPPKQVHVRSVVAGLPLELAQRQNDAALERLGRERLHGVPEAVELRAKASKGTATLASVALDNGLVAAESGLGDRGVRAEEVGRGAANRFVDFVASGASCDEHQGDQLLLPAALAAGGYLGPHRETRFTPFALTEHLTTHASVIRAFLDVDIELGEDLVVVRPTSG